MDKEDILKKDMDKEDMDEEDIIVKEDIGYMIIRKTRTYIIMNIIKVVAERAIKVLQKDVAEAPFYKVQQC